MSARRQAGFTLIEMMVVVAIIVVLATLAVLGFQRARPRATLATVSTEIHALFRNARQNAMSTGRNTIVLVFPNAANRQGGTGRVIVIEDPSATFFQTTAAVNFGNFDPDTNFQTGTESEILLSLDFPRGLRVGGDWTSLVLPAPYAAIDTTQACGFCGGGDGRGAVQYDSRGRATFHSGTGAALDLWGAALSLWMRDQSGANALGAAANATARGAAKMLVLTSTTGSVRMITRG